MSDDTRTLLEAALKLPQADRALLAEELWRSTGPGRSLDDPDYLREVERRAALAIAGKSEGRYWNEFRAALVAETAKR